MKRLLLLCLFCWSAQAIAQKHVEVVVSDTIMLQSTQVLMKVGAIDRFSFFGEDFDILEPDMEEDPYNTYDSPPPAGNNDPYFGLSEDEKLILTRDHLTASGYQCEDSDDGDGFLVRIKPGEMESLRQRLLKESNAPDMVLHEAIYESPDAHYTRIYNSIFTQAKAQAEMLATVMGSKLGGVISAEEVGPDSGIGFNYSELMKEYQKMPMFKSMFNAEVELSQPYTRTFRIRFALL